MNNYFKTIIYYLLFLLIVGLSVVIGNKIFGLPLNFESVLLYSIVFKALHNESKGE